MRELQEHEWKRIVGAAVGGVVLMVMGWSICAAPALTAKRALNDGIPGTYTLESCERDSRGRKHCRRSFRADDGRSWGTVVSPDNGHQSGGLDVGDSFPARYVPPSGGPLGDPAIARSDDTGRANITELLVSAGGMAAAGLFLIGFALRRVLMRPDADAWETIGFFLGLGVAAGVVVYVVWYVLGSGL
ncbi:hypothetical protein [Actinomadura rifamycini]|uniref:hypothetical protein n=1 Tax=Actinomadura rifamycini TaxID=31962 RepID=UPI000405B35A|nr:hypothetical protein [Actinomadura rifamycini]